MMLFCFGRVPKTSFELFLAQMNKNKYGLKFTAECSLSVINYLDLTLTKNQKKIGTKTFFKETDRNGFVPTHSCHHPQWLGAIPKRQYMRIRRNCDNIKDFQIQAEVLTNRFLEKGYPLEMLIKIKDQVSLMDRVSLLATNKKLSLKEK